MKESQMIVQAHENGRGGGANDPFPNPFRVKYNIKNIDYDFLAAYIGEILTDFITLFC